MPGSIFCLGGSDIEFAAVADLYAKDVLDELFSAHPAHLSTSTQTFMHEQVGCSNAYAQV
jgi:hypothetical protein